MIIKLENVSKQFNQKNLFEIEQYQFSPGMIHGILGNNGVGKTTLLRIIAGLDKKYSGSIVYNQELYSDTLIKKITYLSQKPYMLTKTVYENIAYPLKLRKYSKEDIDHHVHLWLEKLEIGHLSDRKATVLSAGERQKVSMARGLIFNPQLVLLDEPTANIDPKTIKVFEDIIVDYQKASNATVIVVTHSLSQALRMCDGLSILSNASLIEKSKEEVLASLNRIDRFEALEILSDELYGV